MFEGSAAGFVSRFPLCGGKPPKTLFWLTQQWQSRNLHSTRVGSLCSGSADVIGGHRVIGDIVRIAHLTPLSFDQQKGGGERYVHNLVTAICRAADTLNQGITQTVITLGNHHSDTFHSGFRTLCLPRDYPDGHPMDASSELLWDVLPEFDLVHIHQILTNFGLVSTAISRSLGKTSVGTDHGGGDNRLMIELGADLLDGIVAVSAFAARQLGSFMHPILVASGPIDTERFQPGTRQQSNYVKRLLAVGRLLPHKGLDRIIAALCPEIELRIVGPLVDAAYYDYLCHVAAQKNVVFLNDRTDEELIAEYQQADAFVQASTCTDYLGRPNPKAELMGFTTLEAMSCGLPVIVANTTSLPELIEPDRSGFVFSTVNELRLLLMKMASGVIDLQSISARARMRAAQFAYPNFGRRVIEFYHALIDGTNENSALQ